MSATACVVMHDVSTCRDVLLQMSRAASNGVIAMVFLSLSLSLWFDFHIQALRAI